MKRGIFAVVVAASLLAAPPVFADAPSAGCPTGFVEKEQNLPPGTKGPASASVNESTEACFKLLENAPEQLKELIGVDEVEVVTDDVVGGPR
jgi:hypothetical protein